MKNTNKYVFINMLFSINVKFFFKIFIEDIFNLY